MVAETLGDELEQFTVRIFATDIDEGAINFARNGLYSRQALLNLSEEMLGRYFEEGAEGEYRVNKLIRNMIVFGEHDLGQRSPFPRMDMMLSRNVLIYFTPELQRRALDLFAYSLRDEGRLVLGSAESASQRGEYFEPESREQKVFRRRGGRFTLPPSLTESPSPMPRSRSSLRLSPETRLSSHEATGRTSRKLPVNEDSVLLGLPVGVVVVDSRYDIRLINSAAQSLLAIHRPAIGEDVIHLLQGAAYTELRPAIDAALREQSPIEIEEFAIEEPESGIPRYLKLVVHPHTDRTDSSGAQDSVMIVIDEMTALGRERDELKQLVEQQAAELGRSGSLNQRLTGRNRRLER